jgi:predicted transcriptional regulator
MENFVDHVKADILAFMAEHRLDVGHVLPERPFYFQRAIHYTPPQQDAIAPALESLVADGVLEQRGNGYFLTPIGFKRLYPDSDSSAVDFVRNDILNFLRNQRARAGHALALRPFAFQRLVHYNPQQKNAVEPALQGLVTDGTLEQKNDGYFLTQSGYEQLY